jgi:hypothetical protein
VSNLKMRVAGLAAATAITGGLAIGTATPSSAETSPPSPHASPRAVPTPLGTCGGIYNPVIGAGKAHWELSCRDGKITVSGYVQDTRADSQCVKVQAMFEGGITEYSHAACPKGDKRNFSWAHPGSIADVQLFAYDV